MLKQQNRKTTCQVQNVFKTADKKEMSSLVTAKMARAICRAESNETVKLFVLAK